jgi:hypothetical protein
MIRNFGRQFRDEKRQMAYFFQRDQNVLIEKSPNPGPFDLKLSIPNIRVFGTLWPIFPT